MSKDDPFGFRKFRPRGGPTKTGELKVEFDPRFQEILDERSRMVEDVTQALSGFSISVKDAIRVIKGFSRVVTPLAIFTHSLDLLEILPDTREADELGAVVAIIILECT